LLALDSKLPEGHCLTHIGREGLPSIVVCAYDVATLSGPFLLKGGFECHPLTFRRGFLRHNEHHVPPRRFLEELSAGSG